MIVLAFDPGQTTGVAALRFDGGKFPPTVVAAGNLISMSDLMEWWNMWIGLPTKSRKADQFQVVVEDFHLFPGAAKPKIGSSFPEIRVIGHIELLCHLTETPIIKQQPSIQLTWSGPTLTRHGVTLARLSPHEMSAIKHGFQWCKLESLSHTKSKGSNA